MVMKEQTVTLDSGLLMLVYNLSDDVEWIDDPQLGIEDEQESVLERYANIYYNEDLIRICDKPYPFVLLTSASLENLSMIMEGRYIVPERFKKFTDKVLEELLRRNPHLFDGPSLRVKDVKAGEAEVKLTMQRTGYFNFLATNLSQDVPLTRYDTSFGSGETLRDYEVREGKSVDLKKSNMANVFGISYIMSSGDYFLLVRNTSKRAVEPSTLSNHGSTPDWREGFEKRYARGLLDEDYYEIDAQSYLRDHVGEELMEELLLGKDEYDISQLFLMKDFTRAPDAFTVINTKLSPDKIAEKCYGKEFVLKEYDFLFAIPKDRRALGSLIHSNMKFSLPGRIAIYLGLESCC